MPAFSTIFKASPSEPFLGVVLEFDLKIMRDVLNELATPPAAGNHKEHGVFVTDFSGPRPGENSSPCSSQQRDT